MDHQFRNILEKELSPGEWAKIFQQIPADDLVNSDHPLYKKKGLSYQIYDPKELLQESPALLKTPILRIDQKFHLGYNEKNWKQWLS